MIATTLVIAGFVVGLAIGTYRGLKGKSSDGGSLLLWSALCCLLSSRE